MHAGHVMFTLAMGYDNFWLAFAGEALHGLGSGTVVVGMRSVVSKFFLENELTFALVRRSGRSSEALGSGSGGGSGGVCVKWWWWL